MGVSEPTMKQLLDTACDDPAFLAALQDSVAASAPPQAIDDLPSITGIADETTARLITFMRRINGFPRFNAQYGAVGDDYWLLPPSLLVSMHDIASRASSHSHLWHAAQRLAHQGLPDQRLFEDIRAAALRDKLVLPTEALRAIIVHGEAPRTSGERLVANTLGFIRETAEGTNSLRRGDYEGVLQRITEGTAFAWTPQSSSQQPLPPTILAGLQRWGTHPLFGLLMHSEVMWYHRPFPACNGLMEVACRHAACHRIGMPALSLVPLSSLHSTYHVPNYAVPTGDFGVDRTEELLELIDLITESLIEAERALLAAEEEMALRKQRISLDYRLNHRQVALAHRMIDDPTLVIDVGSYRQQFDVALTTARDDLKRLVELDYCRTAYQGKRQIFWPNGLTDKPALR